MSQVQEAPVEQEQDAFDPDIIHTYCFYGPRNWPRPTVMCCGFPDAECDEDAELRAVLNCPLCALAKEQPRGCACWK